MFPVVRSAWTPLASGDAEQTIRGVALMKTSERLDAGLSHAADQTIAARFESQVARSPDAIALVCGHEQLTYAELNARANRLAHALGLQGVHSDVCVGICLARSPEIVIAILAVLKAGGAYVPLDPAYPAERLSFIARDARCRLVISDETSLEIASCGPWPTLDVHTGRSDRDLTLTANLSHGARARDLAYVIYTSGSTGQPKGVAIEHASVINLVEWALSTFSAAELRGMLASTSISFDLSVFELFVPLLSGGTVVLVDNLLALPEVPADARITFVNTVPSLMREFLRLNTLPDSVRVVALAGEPLSAALVDQLHAIPSVHRVFDLYGPTETTVYATAAVRTAGGPVTIGRPIANLRAFVLDSDHRQVRAGMEGELYLGGVGLARGYLGRADLTAERFVSVSLGESTERLYRTGDWVRLRSDGALEYLGRIDRQVKLRGFRVELAEIEAALRECEELDDAAVVAREYGPDDLRLVAYVVGKGTEQEIYASLERRLPSCMIPITLVHLGQLPRLPNGKVDYGALPSPAARAIDSPATGATDEAVLEAEAALSGIWRQILGVSRISSDADFFDSGGNSLLAVRLFSEIHKRFGIHLPPATLFRSGTIASQARLLCSQPEHAPWSPIVPLQPAGSKPPFFLVHGIGGEVYGFNVLVKRLGLEHPIYGLRAGGYDAHKAASSIEDVARTYVSAMRNMAPRGPYYVGGYSAGGIIAYEMAQQLRAAGEDVALLAMLDATAPGPHPRAHALAGWGRWIVNTLYWPFDDNFFRSGLKDQVARLRSKVKAMQESSRQSLGFEPSATADVRDLLGLWNVPDNARAYLENYVRMINAYTPRDYDGDIVVLRARTLSLSYRGPVDLGWRRLARGDVKVRIVPGAHDTILEEPRVQRLAQALIASLDEAVASTQPVGTGGRVPAVARLMILLTGEMVSAILRMFEQVA